LDYNEWREEIHLVGTMINQRYEAVIVVPTYYDERKTASFYKRLHCGGTLVTLIDHTLVGSAFAYVIQSYDLGVKRAVDYLLAKCQGALAFVKNSVWLKQNTVQAVMKETFENIVTKNDPGRETIIIDDVHALTYQFIQEKKLQGFFCCDDIDAIRIIGRLKVWGIAVPEQAIIVSYGNTDLAQYFTPPITAINPYYAEMARITAEIIDRQQQGEDVSLYQYVLQPDLIIRAT
jgi:DNA-binding LacI/PurR family transcriptional regulator